MAKYEYYNRKNQKKRAKAKKKAEKEARRKVPILKRLKEGAMKALNVAEKHYRSKKGDAPNIGSAKAAIRKRQKKQEKQIKN